MKRKERLGSSAQQSSGENAKIVTDPQGSYTGRPVDPLEVPVQDADDL